MCRLNFVSPVEVVDGSTLGSLGRFSDGEQVSSVQKGRSVTVSIAVGLAFALRTYWSPPCIVEAKKNSSGDTKLPPGGTLTPAWVGFLNGPVPLPPGKVFLTPASFRLSALSELFRWLDGDDGWLDSLKYREAGKLEFICNLQKGLSLQTQDCVAVGVKWQCIIATDIHNALDRVIIA